MYIFFKCSFSVLHIQTKKSVGFILVTGYRPPCSVFFLLEFADFLSSLVVNSDKVVIVGDFKIHMDSEGDPLRSAFNPSRSII